MLETAFYRGRFVHCALLLMTFGFSLPYDLFTIFTIMINALI